MKNLITSIFLLFSLAMFGQDWQLDGTKYPNATNEGDTVSLATKVPLWDGDNLQNYFADLGDILALNPAPTLQSVTDSGNETTNGITASNLKAHYFQALNASNNDRIFIEGGVSGNHIKFVRGVSGEYSHRIDADMKDIVFETTTEAGPDSYRNLVLLGGERDYGNLSDFTSAEFYGRVKGEPGQDEDDFITLGQMQDSISSHTPDLSDYVDRTTNQNVSGQKTWEDINLFNSPTLFNDRIEVGRIGMNPTLGGWAYNNGGSFSYTTDDMFTFRPMGDSVPAGSLDFTNLTSNRVYTFPNKSGELLVEETGTFVPTLDAFGSNVTDYSVLEAYYSKVGSQVHVVAYFSGITTDGDITQLQIGNLPYPVRTGFLRGGFGQAQVNNTGSTGGSIQAYSIVQGGNVFITRNETGVEPRLDVTFNGGNASFSVTYISNNQ